MDYFEIAKSIARTHRDILLELINKNYENADSYKAKVMSGLYSDEELERIIAYETKRLKEREESNSVCEGE